MKQQCDDVDSLLLKKKKKMQIENCFVVDAHTYQRVTGSSEEKLEQLAAYNRINALSCMYRAQRGWVGASLSVTEILTALYFDVAKNVGQIAQNPCERDRIILGKGHAAPMQYACLTGCGVMSVEQLLKYEHKDGPQAHTDVSTPGIDVTTGSLGQSLSKAVGLALAGASHVFVVLGDGELQEGQNYEALMTLNQRQLPNITVIVDSNGLQTDSQVSDIMEIPGLANVLLGFGHEVVELGGNNIGEVLNALRNSRNMKKKSPIVIAHTQKGAGVSFMAANTCERRKYNWHGGAPNEEQYKAALRELSQSVTDFRVTAALVAFTSRAIGTDAPVQLLPTVTGESTGAAFGKCIFSRGAQKPLPYVFDADLEKSCKLTAFATGFPEQFQEMGISEQDMVSTAGGFALQGLFPVVNTYAAFYRRAYEQIYVNAIEGRRILYAGHYSGLCYATDGKTHQCTGDVAMFRAIPGVTVLYPTFPEEIDQMVAWAAVAQEASSVYIRLHRTPALRMLPSDPSVHGFKLGFGVKVFHYGSKDVILTSGPHMVAFCCAAGVADVFSVSTIRPLSPEFVQTILSTYKTVFIVEELFETGGLFDEFNGVAAKQRLKGLDVRHKAVTGMTFSTLEQEGLYRHYSLTPEGIAEFVKQK